MDNNNFKAKIIAELDLTAIEQKLSELQGKKINVKIDADGGSTAQKEVESVDKAVTTATKHTETFGTKLKQAFSSYLGFRLVREAFQKITEAIKDADEAITNLREATGDTYAETQRLVSGYTKLGQALGATTEEVSASADEWLRQGKSVADTNTLIRDAMILSKIGQIDSADATEYLTSAMKGYNIEANDAISIVDKLSAVDMVSATDAGGLAEAMSKVAVTADMAGISMDKLIGYVATVGEVTQDSMSSVGNSMKTILTRMSDIKAGKLELVDEDGTVETLSDVETTLKNVGIDLRSTLTEYNNYGDVLDELAAKWDDLSQVQQNALAKAFAGTRQGERFRVLMENYDTAIQYANTAAESAGTAEEKFNAYLDSIEAKTKSLQAAFEALATDTVSTETVGNIIDATTALVNFIDTTHLLEGGIAGAGIYALIKAFKLLRTGVLSAYTGLNNFNNALKMVKAGNIGEKQIQQLAKMTVNLSDSQLKAVLSSKNLTNAQKLQILQAQGLSKAEAQAKLEALGFSTAEDGATISTYSLTGALKGLWATIQANPLLPLTLAITAVVSAYQSYKQSVEEQRQAAMDAADAASDELDSLTELYDAYSKAAQAVVNNTGSKDDLTEATAALLKALGYEETQVQDLIDKYGDLDTAINNVTADSLQHDIGALTDGYIAAQKNLTDAAESKHIFKDMDLTFALNSADTNTKDVLSAAGINPSDYAQIFSDIDSTFKFHTDDTDRLITAYERLIELRDILANGMSAEELSDSRVFDIVSTRISDISDEYEDVIGYIDDINTAVAKLNYIQYVDTRGVPQTTEEFNALTDALEKGAASNQNYVGTQEQINSSIQSVLSQIPALTDYMTDLTDTTTQAAQAIQSWEELNGVFDSYTESMTNLASIQEAIANGFVISAEKAREFAEVFPEILSGAQATADGQIQLNSDVVNSFLAAKEAELQANIDTQIAALNAEKAVLEAKKSSAQAQLEVAKNVGEGEGQISLEEAKYRIDLGNQVAQALIEAGIDEATAYKIAASTMAQNSQEFNSVVASVAEDVDTNLCTAFWDAATSSFTNANAMKTNLATVVKQAHELAKAIKAAITGEVAGSEAVIQGGSTGAQTSKFNVQNSQVTFTGADFDYQPKTVSLDELTSNIELDISEYENAIAEIDGQIATLEALRSTSIKDYTTSGGTSKKSGSGGSSSKSSSDSAAEDAEKEVEEYLVDIEAYRDALQRVAEIEAEQERLENQLDLATTDADKLDIYERLNDIYKQRQEALHTLNEQRRGIISEKVDELQAIGFDVEYNADTNTFYVKNLEHLNELQAETAGEYDTLQEATNAYRKEVEQTISDLEELNEDNQSASETWYKLQKNIADTTEKIDELNMNALSDAVDRIEQAYNDYSDAMDKANERLDDEITKEQALYDIMSKHYDAVNELTEAQHEADQAIADSRISKAYLSESEYSLIYNEEDYNAISQTISKIGKQINNLTDKYNKQVEDALANDQAYLIENISAEYERQVDLKMQELEIAQAELEVTKKQTELNNALEERNIRQLVEKDGKLQYEWVADTDKVRSASEGLSDAQYNLQQAQTEKRQQTSLNNLQSTIDDLENQQEANNALVEEFGKSVDAVKTKLDELQNPVTSLEDSISLLQTSAVGEFAEAIQDLLDEITKITNAKYSIDVDGIKYTGLNVSGGYASGTRSASSGLHWVDEKGNETYFTNDGVLHDFSGGETVLNAAQTQRLYELVSGMDIPVSHGNAENILRSLSLDAAKPSETLKSMQSYYNSDNSHSYNFSGDINVNNPADFNALIKELTKAVNRKMK